MKNDSTATFLNLVLAALVFLGVLFALLNIWRTRELRSAQPRAQMAVQAFQVNAMRVQPLINDTVAFNATKKSPELAQILQVLQPAAPAAK